MLSKRLLPIYIILLFIALGVMFLLGKHLLSVKKRDFSEIRKEGVLRVVTEYNSVDYYVSGDTTLGLQYNLCKFIEKQSGLNVEIHLENNLNNCIKGLEQLQYDVIAHNIPITTENKQTLAFTEPITQNKQVLVQRKASANNELKPIRSQIDLAKKTLYIPQNSPVILRLRNLSEEIADTIYIREEKQYNAEQLIYMVAEGDIDYAVVDQEIALKNMANFPQIDFQTDITFTQLQAWAIRKNAPVLLDSLNSWISAFSPSGGGRVKNEELRVKN